MDSRRVGEVITYVRPFVPVQDWFDHPEEARVWVSAYRAYFVPSESVSVRRTLRADFGQVRAVFLLWNAPYVKPDQNIIEQGNRKVTMQIHPLHEYRTGPGVLLLLITPLPAGGDPSASDRAMERVRFVRSLIVAFMGRNAAYRRDTMEEDVDKFINCWLAWETLVMERYNDINTITCAFADMHGREVQHIAINVTVPVAISLQVLVLYHRSRYCAPVSDYVAHAANTCSV